jgi:hypothetical protein
MWYLAYPDQCCDRLGALGACEAVCEATRAHYSNQDVVETGLMAFAQPGRVERGELE